MHDDLGNRITVVELLKALLSVLCLGAATITVAMSLKQWSASAHVAEACDHEIIALRDDVWLGISKKAAQPLLCLTVAFFMPITVFAALRRTPVHYVACTICGLGLISATLIWATTPRI